MTDAVNHPDHYQLPGNCTEIADLTIRLPHARACAIEYIWRAGKKDGTLEKEDLRKAIWWLEREIERLV